MKILSNLPIEDLNSDNDYLGIIEKGDMIVSLLKSDAVDLSKIKMFALYGNWGSGKSTLMKYMKKQFDVSDENFKTFYFDAWQYENGRDLSYSLLEFMIDEGLDKGEKTATEILEAGRFVLMGFAKSASFSIPGLRFTPKELIDELQKDSRKSFHSEIQEFKKEFLELENKILSTDSVKYNIVFIDDLDRCEPEKVLDLLSEIKLFFTYGKRTIFFFGVDEKAVQIAIKNKYRETIKSSEYLEKIFDFTFSMPTDYSLNKLLSQHFKETTIKNIGSGVSLIGKLEVFFKQIRFTEPRKLKKLLNSYTLFTHVADFKENDKNRTPLINEDSGSFLYTLITIYLLILKNFYPELLVEFGESNLKKTMFIEAYDRLSKTKEFSSKGFNYFDNIFSNSHYYSSVYFGLEELINPSSKIYKNSTVLRDIRYSRFTCVFAPTNVKTASTYSLCRLGGFNDISIERKKIDYYMTRYLIVNIIDNKYKLGDNDRSELALSHLAWRVNNYL